MISSCVCANKTEFMWCVPSRRRHQLPEDPLLIHNHSVQPVTRPRSVSGHWYVDGLAHQPTRLFVPRHLETDTLQTSLVITFIVVNTDHGVHSVTARLTIVTSHCPAWPWASTVGHQCCCSSYDHVTPLLKDRHCSWLRLSERITCVRSCIQLSSRYGATLLTIRRHPACRCNLAPSSPVDILVRPGGSSHATNYDLRPSFSRRGTSCMEVSSSSGTFRKYLDVYLFLCHSRALLLLQPANSVKRTCLYMYCLSDAHTALHSQRS